MKEQGYGENDYFTGSAPAESKTVLRPSMRFTPTFRKTRGRDGAPFRLVIIMGLTIIIHLF